MYYQLDDSEFGLVWFLSFDLVSFNLHKYIYLEIPSLRFVKHCSLCCFFTYSFYFWLKTPINAGRHLIIVCLFLNDILSVNSSK